jgi:hypothetical protein
VNVSWKRSRENQPQGGAREATTAISGDAGRNEVSWRREKATVITVAMKTKKTVTRQAALLDADGNKAASNTATRQRNTVSLRNDNIA